MHDASLLNVKVDHPNAYCKGGLLSYSTDQVITVTSAPVVVDVVKLGTPPEGWGDQAVFLVAEGGSVEDLTVFPPEEFLFDSVPQLQLPGTASVERRSDKPGTGELPDALPFTTVCTEGDGKGGYKPPPSDCGTREFALSMGLIATVPGKVTVWATDLDPSAEQLYQNCTTDQDMAPGMFMGNEDETSPVTRTDADLPAVEQLLDPAVSSDRPDGQR